jgi:hypothetical protein
MGAYGDRHENRLRLWERIVSGTQERLRLWGRMVSGTQIRLRLWGRIVIGVSPPWTGFRFER